MRRLIILGIVAQLGLAPLGVGSVSAQAWENYAWQGVTVEEPVSARTEGSAEPFQLLADFLGEPKENQIAGPGSIAARLTEAYRVTFTNDPNSERYAFIPEVQGAELMIVIVNTGEFVVDVKGPGSFLVDPVVGRELTSKEIDKVRIMHAEIIGTEVEYTPTEQFVLDEKGNDCTSLCTVLPGVAVQVTDGDRIIAPAGAICIWCLLNQNEHTTKSEGELYVFPLLNDGEIFSWSQYDESVQATQQGAAEQKGEATPEQLTGAAPWALFNPSTNCRG
jgi:hypothetical protein